MMRRYAPVLACLLLATPAAATEYRSAQARMAARAELPQVGLPLFGAGEVRASRASRRAARVARRQAAMGPAVDDRYAAAQAAAASPAPPPAPPAFAPRRASASVPTRTAAPPASYAGLVAQHASANGVPAALVHRVIMRESRYNPRAVSKGNFGMMQIRLGTARAMGYSGSAAGLLDAHTNMTYAVRYLAGAYRVAGGNHDRAVALYARGYYYDAKRQGVSIQRAAAAPSPLGGFASARRDDTFSAAAREPRRARR